MPSAEEEKQHTVFDDDEEDDDDSEEEEEEEDDDEEDEDEEDETPPKVVSSATAVRDLNSSSSSSDLTPVSNPNSSAPASAPQNGAIQPLPLSSVPADSSNAAVAVTVAVAGDVRTPSPDGKRQKISASEEKKPSASAFDDSRRLFQRLWTDDDEIVILKGFLEFTSQRGTSYSSHHHDTAPFYDQIKARLQLDFTKNQLVEKLRRLKKKYRNVVNRIGSAKEFAFKSPHEQATFEISRKIWSSSLKRSEKISRSRRRRKRLATAVEVPVEDGTAATQTPSSSVPNPTVIEDTVRSCLSPLFKELLYCAIGGPSGPGLGGGGVALNPMPLNFGSNLVNLPGSGVAVDEKWRKQQILELEVYLKRIELVQEQVKSTLEELRSLGG